MAIYRTDFVDVDLRNGMNRTYWNHQVGEADKAGDVFGCRILNGGEEEDLTGVTVIGYFTRKDQTTVTINGTRNGSRIYVTLPKSCYAVEGNFQLAIKMVTDDRTVTARIVEGTVIDTAIGALVDPGDVIPSLADYTQLVEDAEAAAEEVALFSITETLISGTRYKLAVTTVS